MRGSDEVAKPMVEIIGMCVMNDNVIISFKSSRIIFAVFTLFIASLTCALAP